MSESNGLYTITIRGERNKYALRGSEVHSLDVVAGVVSDLTGYRKDFLLRDRNQGLRRMSINEERKILPANLISGTPHFLITRVA